MVSSSGYSNSKSVKHKRFDKIDQYFPSFLKQSTAWVWFIELWQLQVFLFSKIKACLKIHSNMNPNTNQPICKKQTNTHLIYTPLMITNYNCIVLYAP